jgi:hypothetical protein
VFTLKMQWPKKFQGTTKSSSLPCWGSKIEVIALAKGICFNNGFWLCWFNFLWFNLVNFTIKRMFSWVWFLIIISVVRDYVLLLYSILINNFIIFDVWIYDFIAKLYNHIVNVVCYFNEVYYLNNNFGTTLEVTYWSLASVQSVGHMAYSIL